MNYIVILNYNNWDDTIECLESVLKMKNIDFKIIVCDNNSTDNSFDYIEKWIKGKIIAECKSDNRNLINLVYPLEKKPISYKILYKNDLINEEKSVEEKIILIQNGENRGYSAGNNIGIKYAIQKDDCEYIWILNNDTVVTPMALKFLVETMEKNSKIGICGSKTFFYYNPNKIQCESGFKYNKWLAYPFKMKDGYKQKSLSYVNGAAMFVRKSFIEEVGYLCEDYFLYYEEIDWALRGKDKYILGYNPNSIIYHKEGGSINKNKKKSLISDFYAIRNRILVTKKFYKYCLPTVYFGILIAIFNRIRRGEYKRAWIFIKIMFTAGNIKYIK